MPKCWAVQCPNISGVHPHKRVSGELIPASEKVTFHNFPLKNPHLLSRWLLNIGRTDCLPSQTSKLCSSHFLPRCFETDFYAKYMHISPSRKSRRPKILKSGAVPSEFFHHFTPKSRTPSDKKERIVLKPVKKDFPSPTRKRLIKTIMLPDIQGVIQQEISQTPGPSRLLTTENIQKKGPSPAKKKRVETVTQAVETQEEFLDFPITDALQRKIPASSNKKRLENVAEAEIPTALLVDVVEPPMPSHSAFTGLTPTKITPLKYRCAHGTPRKVLRDHAYFKKTTISTYKTFGTQTDEYVDNKPPCDTSNEGNVQPLQLSSPISSESEKEDSPIKSSDFEPLSPSSTSTGDSSDEKESQNVCYTPKYIVFESNLEQLFKFCSSCGSPVTEFNKFKTGSMISYKVSCHSGHSNIWRSQPMIRKEPVGNLLISAAILTTGNTFAKLLAFAEHLKLNFISKSVFYRIQKENLFPVIQEAWKKERESAVAKIKETYRNKELVLSGDARCDSPGHTAKYGSYTLMDASPDVGTRKIVSLQLVQVSEVPNSNHMEPVGLKRCLAEVENDKLDVSILATDRHLMVNSIMDKEYKKIQHQFDTWHVSKGVVKKLSTKAKGKDYAELSPWIQSISNHLWWCCATCKGDEQLLREKWISVLQHISNRHSWSGNSQFHACDHPPMATDDAKTIAWLNPKSKAFTALQSIVLDKFLLKAMKKMTKFCHTGDLEVFHNTLLKFCPKRQHFPYEGMSARLMLAAFDWNRMEMVQKKDRSGNPATSVVYSKRRKLYVLRNTYSRVKTDHMLILMQRIFEVFRDQILLEPFKGCPGPQGVAKIPKPTKSELAQKFKSRFH